MYYKEKIDELVSFIRENNGISDKSKLTDLVKTRFNLIKDRSVYYCEFFAIRFCKLNNQTFSNTVLSLSSLQKYDNKPFIVCLVTSTENYLLLANTTFLTKISHSSQTLRVDNIKGSFNGSDIMRNFEEFKNIPENFEFLFTSHENYSFEDNLIRLVENTNNISATGNKFIPNDTELESIKNSIQRANNFIYSNCFNLLEKELEQKVSSVSSEIAIAAFIENVNLRGRIIEYLITSPDDLKIDLIQALHNNQPLPKIYTADKLGDYEKIFSDFHTQTDIKTKIMFLSSNPKGYNIDKLLEFLAKEKTVYLIFIVAINEHKEIKTQLCSIFNQQLLNGTRIIKHWAGRNSRGVTQFDGKNLVEIVEDFDKTINVNQAKDLIDRFLA
ncbi:MAG: hypothetical protein IKI11_02085 [Neisseriaceae bacterium]|nr:hypothetical protein [Neisseriaceae bacterium]